MNKILHKIKYNLKKYFIETPKAIYLCLRFPFLYPRNRFTGRHYNNWKLDDLIMRNRKGHHFFLMDKAYEKCEVPHKYYIKLKDFEELGTYYEFWNNWYSKYICIILNWIHDHPLQWIHCIPTYTELDAMPEGWRKAFGIRMCKDLKKLLKKEHKLYSYRIVDIKEKWGMLDWSDNNGTVDTTKLVEMYEYISEHICVVCGELATKRSVPEVWECPYCDKHFPKDHKYYIEFGLDELPWFGWTGNINQDPNFEEAKKICEDYKKNRF